MSSDGPGSSRKLLNYFSTSSSSSESAPSPSNNSSLPESDVSSGEHVTAEVHESPDGRSVLELYQSRNVVFLPSKFGVQSRNFQAG